MKNTIAEPTSEVAPAVVGQDGASTRLSVALVDMHLDRFRGGMSTALSNLAEQLINRCDVTIICSRASGSYPPALKVIQLPSLPFSRFLLEFSTFRTSWAIYRRLAGVARRYDLVHCASPLYGGADLASVHFCSAEYAAVLWRDRAAFYKHGWSGLLMLLYRLFSHGIAAILEKIAYARMRPARTELLAPVSEGLQAVLNKRFKCAVPMRVIPNALDLSRYEPKKDPELRQTLLAEAGWPENTFLLLFVGAGDWQRKGLDVVIDALQVLPDAIRMAVVGGGDQDYFSRVATTAGVRQRLHFTGVRKDVHRLYQAVDLFVFPSRYEAQPLVCLEAMASGLPMVVASFHGVEDYLRDGVNGLMVERNASEFRAAIQRLFEDAALRARLSQEAVRTSQRFRKERVADEFLAVYGQIVSHKQLARSRSGK